MSMGPGYKLNDLLKRNWELINKNLTVKFLLNGNGTSILVKVLLKRNQELATSYVFS